MNVAELGEFGLIDLLAETIGQAEAAVPPSPAAAPLPAALLVGIGDDAAAWRSSPGVEIATTDTLVAGIHFLPNAIPPADLGWKALAVNLSDIAAMGGIPRYALITLGLPPDTDVEAVTALYRGMLAAAAQYGVRLAGGDIVRSPVLFITVALTGVALTGAPGDGVLRRDAARPGDTVAVTGMLGASAAGLDLVLHPRAVPPDCAARLLAAHHRPTPRVAEGQALLRAGVRAAMDISDGLVADLGKLCRASGVAARILAERVPADPCVRQQFPEAWQQLALTGGEDYELLCCAPVAVLDQARTLTTTPLTVIGEIIAGEPGRVNVVDRDGRALPLDRGGWDHLAGQPS